jgi:hypothetical protein
MKIAATIAGLATLAGVAHADVLHERLDSLIARGETLYAQAEKVVGAHPTTQQAANEIAATLGKTFSQDEAAYQIAFLPLVDKGPGRLRADLDEGFVRVWTFDILLSQAVAESYNCHHALAQHDLMIARQLLDHARLAAEGRPQPHWASDAKAPQEAAKCQ